MYALKNIIPNQENPMIKLFLGFIIGIGFAYWAQPWLNEVEHVKTTKTVTSVRNAAYKKCEQRSADLVGTGIWEGKYDCGNGESFFVRTKSESYWVERAIRR